MGQILSISSHVVAGRVGQSITSFAFQELGHEVWALPTVLSLQPRAGILRGGAVPQEIFEAVIDGLCESDLSSLAALHIGYLRTPEQVRAAVRMVEAVRIAAPRALVLVDPILGDAPVGRYVPKDAADAITSKLVPRADILTPNLFELGYLAGREVARESDAVAAARSLGARLVAVTSAPDAEGRASTLLVGPDRAHRVITTRFETAPHGTGDLFAALFLARLLKGEAALEALAAAISSVHGLIGAARAAGLSYLPHIEHRQLLVSPPPCVEIERIG